MNHEEDTIRVELDQKAEFEASLSAEAEAEAENENKLNEEKYFTEQEANELIGKNVKALREFSGIPIGTIGKVTGKYFHNLGIMEKKYGVDVKWKTINGHDVVDGFSKADFEYLEVVKK